MKSTRVHSTMLLFAGSIAFAVAACTPQQPDSQVQPLVEAAWLNGHLDQVVVLDIRTSDPEAEDVRGYEVSHIPGAVHSPYRGDAWRVTRDGVPSMAPPVEDLEKLIGGLGISNDDHVVIVPAGESAVEFASATRVYWQFQVLGHERVSILNGGYAAWTSGGYAVEVAVNEPEAAAFVADVQEQLVASEADVMAAVENVTPLVDARSAKYHTGALKAAAVARFGTIEGALSVPAAELAVADSSGTYLDAERVTTLWLEAGVPIEGEVITFCNVGHWAALAWFVAYELLGNDEARLYDGSIIEWAADPDLPMQTTVDPG